MTSQSSILQHLRVLDVLMHFWMQPCVQALLFCRTVLQQQCGAQSAPMCWWCHD
jgi:hypothetical protein